jgi:hypothetical protein
MNTFMNFWNWIIGLFRKRLALKVNVSPSSGLRGTTFTIVETASGGKPPYTYGISQIGAVHPSQTSTNTFTVVI